MIALLSIPPENLQKDPVPKQWGDSEKWSVSLGFLWLSLQNHEKTALFKVKGSESVIHSGTAPRGKPLPFGVMHKDCFLNNPENRKQGVSQHS